MAFARTVPARCRLQRSRCVWTLEGVAPTQTSTAIASEAPSRRGRQAHHHVARELNASKTDALPNETITITGNGFGIADLHTRPANITLDNVCRSWWTMNPRSTSGGCKDSSGCVEVSNSGQFVATIVLWQAEPDTVTNPTLIPGTHELER